MGKIILNSSEGTVNVPSVTDLERFIIDLGVDFWAYDSQGLIIEYYGEGIYNTLMAYYCIDNGKFYLLYMNSGKDEEKHYAGVDMSNEGSIVEIEIGAEIFPIFDYCTITKEDTLAAFKTFLENKGILESSIWKLYDTIEFPIDERYI